MLTHAALGIFEAEATRQLYLESLGKRSVTIPYGLDLLSIDRVRDNFDRDRARQEAGIPVDADLIICVGTVEPRKAQIPLAQAFELIAGRHPDAQLAFVGSDRNEGSTALAGRIESSPHKARMRMVPDDEGGAAVVRDGRPAGLRLRHRVTSPHSPRGDGVGSPGAGDEHLRAT